MGLNFGYALAKGVEGAAGAGVGLIDAELKKRDTIEAEERAANRQLMLEERMSAIREAAQVRADERREQIRQGGVKHDFDFATNADNVKAKADAEAKNIEITSGAKAKAKADEMRITEPVKQEMERKGLIDSSTPEMLAARRKIKMADHIESASSVASAALSGFQLQQLKKQAALQDEYQAAVESGDKDRISKATAKLSIPKTPTKAEDKGDYLRAATQLTRLIENASDPAEREKYVRERDLLMGMAGVSSDADKPSVNTRAPYSDGTELRGKDGAIYVVKNGVPVKKDGGQFASGKIKQ